MAVTIVYSNTNDGYVQGTNATYSTARSTGASAVAGATQTYFGQNWNGSSYICIETFLKFDVSAVPNVANSTSAVLAGYGGTDLSTTDFTAYAAINNWTAALDTADFIAGASLTGLTTAATLASTAYAAAYMDFTNSGAVLLNEVKAGGTVSLTIYSDRHSGNNTPTGAEYIGIYSADQTGTSQDPKISVSTPSGGMFPAGAMTHLLVR